MLIARKSNKNTLLDIFRVIHRQWQKTKKHFPNSICGLDFICSPSKMPCGKCGLVRLEAWPSPFIVRIVVLLSIFADAQHEPTDCRIEIVSPQIGDTFEAGSGVLLELGLIDCPVC